MSEPVLDNAARLAKGREVLARQFEEKKNRKRIRDEKRMAKQERKLIRSRKRQKREIPPPPTNTTAIPETIPDPPQTPMDIEPVLALPIPEPPPLLLSNIFDGIVIPIPVPPEPTPLPIPQPVSTPLPKKKEVPPAPTPKPQKTKTKQKPKPAVIVAPEDSSMSEDEYTESDEEPEPNVSVGALATNNKKLIYSRPIGIPNPGRPKFQPSVAPPPTTTTQTPVANSTNQTAAPLVPVPGPTATLRSMLASPLVERVSQASVDFAWSAVSKFSWALAIVALGVAQVSLQARIRKRLAQVGHPDHSPGVSQGQDRSRLQGPTPQDTHFPSRNALGPGAPHNVPIQADVYSFSY